MPIPNPMTIRQGRAWATAALVAAAGILTLVPGAGTARAAGCPHAGTAASAVTYSEAKAAVICLLNRRRAAHGMGALRSNAALQMAARRHTADMVHNGFFSHVGSDGSKPVTRIRRTGYLTGYSTWGVGENIAWGTGSYGTPASIVTAWMHSPGHRANVLNARYRQIGVGVVPGAPEHPSASGGTYTTDFGYRR